MQTVSEKRLLKKIMINIAYSFLVGFLLFLIIYGFYIIIITSNIRIKAPYAIMVFTIIFILSSVILEHRGGKIPRLFIGSVLISAILTFFIVCMVNGILAILNNGKLPLDTFLTVYSLCSITAFVGLRILKL